MSKQQIEAEEKVFTEVISGSLALTGSRRRKGRRSVGVSGTQNQEYVNTLKANNILTDSITFINGKGTVTINVGPIGTSNVNQGTNSIAIGSNAGLSNQGSFAVAVGTNAGQFSQGQKTLSIGFNAGKCNFGIESIQIGSLAGQTNTFPRKGRSIAIGLEAGNDGQGSQCVAVGKRTGSIFQSSNSVAVGEGAGNIIQKSFCTAIGPGCGFSNQSTNSVGIGNFCGYINQNSDSVAVGSSSGFLGQSSSNVAIGSSAAQNTQGTNAVAIGTSAGESTQGQNSISIGYYAGARDQGTNSIAIGLFSAATSQGQNCVRIGYGGTFGGTPYYQCNNCVAIGFGAGLNTQLQNTICLGPNVETFTQNSCYVRPIRTDASPAPPGVLTYNTVTGEVIQNTGKTFVIDHPIYKDKYLVHACLEGPEVAVFYKGTHKIDMKSDKQIYINVPTYIKNIAHNFSIFVTPKFNSKIIASSCINNEKFQIIGHGEFDWIIYGTLKTSFREVIDKTVDIRGEGPYTYI